MQQCKIISVVMLLILAATTKSVFAELQDNGDGTVTDANTNLTWQKCSAPSEDTICTVSPTVYIWDDAFSY